MGNINRVLTHQMTNPTYCSPPPLLPGGSIASCIMDVWCVR